MHISLSWQMVWPSQPICLSLCNTQHGFPQGPAIILYTYTRGWVQNPFPGKVMCHITQVGRYYISVACVQNGAYNSIKMAIKSNISQAKKLIGNRASYNRTHSGILFWMHHIAAYIWKSLNINLEDKSKAFYLALEFSRIWR